MIHSGFEDYEESIDGFCYHKVLAVLSNSFYNEYRMKKKMKSKCLKYI